MLILEQTLDVASKIPARIAITPLVEGDEHVTDKIVSYRKIGCGGQFLMIMEGEPKLDATLQAVSDFVGMDGTVTQVVKDYICDKDILHQYHFGKRQ